MRPVRQTEGECALTLSIFVLYSYVAKPETLSHHAGLALCPPGQYVQSRLLILQQPPSVHNYLLQVKHTVSSRTCKRTLSLRTSANLSVNRVGAT